MLRQHRHRLFHAGVFGFAIGGVVLAFYLGSTRISLANASYAGVALASLVASGSMVLPLPGIALGAVCHAAADARLVPGLVAVIAGGAQTMGELTGYFLGYSGRGIISRRAFHRRLETWMQQRGWLVLFLLAAIPNPLFDVAGVAAGASRYSLWRFVIVVLAGKLIKFTALAYGCAWGFQWFF